MDRLPPVDFVDEFVRELDALCLTHLPCLDETVSRHGSYVNGDQVDLNYCRPSVGRGRDVGWRITIEADCARIQLLSGDFDHRILEHIRTVLGTQLSMLVASCVAARAAHHDLTVMLNGLSLPMDKLRLALSISPEVRMDEPMSEFLAQIAADLPGSEITDMHRWFLEAIESMAPIYFAITPRLSMLTVGLPDNEEMEYDEGAVSYRIHRQRERDPRVIERAKRRFRQKHGGRLYCEICDFDFSEMYGDRGRDFAEGHHTRPVSTFGPGDTTRVEDICITCSNCHSMLHRPPLISPQDLRTILHASHGQRHDLS